MKKSIKKIVLNLHLFDGAGGGDGGGASTGSAGTAPGTQMGENKPADAKQNATTGRKANPLANVVYGKQGEAQTATAQADTVKETKAEPETVATQAKQAPVPFDELIKGEYKDDFAKKTQDIINKRFAETRQVQARLDQVSPLTEMLAKKYGVDPTDVAAITKAVENDDAMYAEEAEKRGMSVTQLKAISKLERENDNFKRALEERSKREQSEKVYSEIVKQSETVKQIFPNFDLKTELENNDFSRLIKNGIDVKTAYEVIHKDEIIGGAMVKTAQAVKEQVASNIQSRANRPDEAGISSQTGVVTKKDVSNLSKADREEIARRVKRGESISF